MFGGEVAGKTAVVLLGAHRLHSLAGFLSEGVVPAGLAGDRPKKSAVFRENRAMLGKKKSKPVFCHSKRDELISKGR